MVIFTEQGMQINANIQKSEMSLTNNCWGYIIIIYEHNLAGGAQIEDKMHSVSGNGRRTADDRLLG